MIGAGVGWGEDGDGGVLWCDVVVVIGGGGVVNLWCGGMSNTNSTTS